MYYCNMYSFETKLRVRYGETDQMGFVHHGNYALFFEMGRLDWITKIGVSYKNMESEGILLPVVFLEANYLKSAYYDDELTIETFLLEKPTVRIKFGYNIYNESKDLITKGFNLFINNQILQFENSSEIPLHFVGSIGFYLKENLKSSLNNKGLICGKILKKPIDGLVAYHKNYI